MRITIITLLAFATAAMAQDRPTQFAPTLVDPVLETCTVKVKKELLLPTLDNGALVELAVREGDIVPVGALLGQIDDTEASKAMVVAESAFKSAELNAGEGSDIQIEYAMTAEGVSRNEYEQKKAANRSGIQAVTEMDIERSRLEWERARAQTKVRQLEQRLAGLEVGGKQAEYDAAQKAVARRKLVAPFPGIIVETYRREGEWVQAGEPILRLMSFETMTVNGKVDATRYARQDVDDRPVTVEIELPHGQRAEFTGKITYVSPIADSSSKRFAVEAEVTNRQAGRHWLLPHTAVVKMTIHVN